MVSLCCLTFHDFDFFFGQAVEDIVELMDELVNLFVAGVDLPLDFVLGREMGCW